MVLKRVCTTSLFHFSSVSTLSHLWYFTSLSLCQCFDFSAEAASAYERSKHETFESFRKKTTGKKNGTANQFMSLPKDMAGMQSKMQANKSWCCLLFMFFFPENTCDIFCAFMTELLAACCWNLVFCKKHLLRILQLEAMPMTAISYLFSLSPWTPRK